MGHHTTAISQPQRERVERHIRHLQRADRQRHNDRRHCQASRGPKAPHQAAYAMDNAAKEHRSTQCRNQRPPLITCHHPHPKRNKNLPSQGAGRGTQLPHPLAPHLRRHRPLLPSQSVLQGNGLLQRLGLRNRRQLRGLTRRNRVQRDKN